MPDTCDVELVPPWIWAVMTILQEARNQSFDGMLGVAEVIRDRTKARFYSDGSVISTVLFPFQFSGWNTRDQNRIICGKMELANPKVQDAIRAWRMCNTNNTETVGGALFYHSKHMKNYPSWSKVFPVTAIIQDHIFYKKV